MSENRPVMGSIGTTLKKKGDKYIISGFCIYRFTDGDGKEVKDDEIELFIGESSCGQLEFSEGVSLPKSLKFRRYKISIGEDSLEKLDVQNKIYIKHKDKQTRVLYNAIDLKRGRYRTSKIFKNNGRACYLRQTRYNGLYLTIRELQLYDETVGRAKAWLAWLTAKFWHKKDIIYIYEKECSRYEESGAVLYEKLIDSGHDNAVFIVNASNAAIKTIDDKYKKNLIYKDSFKHLMYFFKSKVFIGTETMAHAMQLRASYKKIVKKTESKNISYIFLQHGVMYMVSMDAAERVSFRQKGLNLYRVVTSSETEAKHFIELGGFKPEELYVSGLAKFDMSMRYDDADKVVIMPTWRRWEVNQARQNFRETKYYKLIKRMFDMVPDALKDKVVILPHPLMQGAMNESNHELKKYLTKESHDETLKKCDLLITDYSSVAYDAFYRGSNVIFYWEEKDECLQHYGADAKLMLTEDMAFGDVCYNPKELGTSILNNYGKPQNEEYIGRYRHIVEFNDGKNSDRIIQMLESDKVI